MKMRMIVAFAVLAAVGVQAGNLATDGVIGNITVGAGDYWQPGTGVGSMDTIINDGVTLSIAAAAYETIIQQNDNGTSSITINTGGTMDFSSASGNGTTLILGNVANNHGIINLAGGTFTGGALTYIAIGRSNGTGEFNISAGTATFPVQPLFGDAGGSGVIKFSNDSTGSLSIAGVDQNYYEGLYAAGNLSRTGGTGTFATDFSVTDTTITAIPEPATLGMVAIFGGSILFIRRKLMI